MSEAHIIQLPLFIFWAGVALLAGSWWLALWTFKSILRDEHKPQPQRDWSVPTVDTAADGDSPFHHWDVRFKLVALLGFAFLVVATRSPWSALIAIFLAFAAVLLARLPLGRSLRRLLAMSGFLSMFLLVMPLTAAVHPGDTLLVFGGWDWFSFNLRGLQLALAVVGKACAVALLMEPLLATASLARTIEGLTRLGVPEKVGQMILLAYRYTFVFLEEAHRMAVGMQVRGFRRRTSLETLRVMGNFLGMLFVRSFERTHRVYAAMQARGYQGRFPAPFCFKVTVGDWLHASLWLVLGVGLLIFDRLGLG
ncbi:MAG: cobalt ECF transporter T component CbiQ [Deltaproteobacteria bacterium]|nr:cobalt ECF transporter T component CbiQ [Deltaproteobacteria bacterium]